MAAERVAIIGAGIGGLATALALKQSGREVVIIERDPEPPEMAPEAAFESWARPGVPQFRHAHIFLARLQTMLRDLHPELLAELRQAGLELSRPEEAVATSQGDTYHAAPGDADLVHLSGRRPTFEYVLRRHVGRLPHVRFVHSARVLGLLTEPQAKQLRVHGVRLTRGGAIEALEADVVVDTSGKRTRSPEWLEAEGVRIQIDSNPSGFIYACRHYRLDDPTKAPSRWDAAGNLDYLGYAMFSAEHGNYALTLGCPVEDTELSDVVRRQDGFEAVCDQLPAFKALTASSTVTSKVLGAGRFDNRWIHYRSRSGREVLGFFAVGDSYIETNPMYGRGCASAFVQAQVLAEVLVAEKSPSARARLYYERTRRLLLPYFNLSIQTDRTYRGRARTSRGLPPSLLERLLGRAYEAAWLPALHTSPLVAREFAKTVQMREVSGVGRGLLVAMRLLLALLASLLGKSRPPLLPAGPSRAELLRALSGRSDPAAAPGAPVAPTVSR